jgi:outer membrane protein
MKSIACYATACVLSLPLFTTAHAHEQGDMIVRVGTHNIDPKSNNGPDVIVDSATQVTFDFTYMFSEDWGIEVLAALPFEHDILTTSGTLVATTEHLPPTISVQYRFGDGKIQPYVGAGINYTKFSSEKALGPIQGANLSLDASTGLALQVGVDFHFGDNMLFNLVLRKIDIESDVTLNGAPLTKAVIDPTAIGVGIGWKF